MPEERGGLAGAVSGLVEGLQGHGGWFVPRGSWGVGRRWLGVEEDRGALSCQVDVDWETS